MPAAPLPPALDGKLAALAAEVRRALALRGLGWFVITVFGGAAAAVTLDLFLDLPGWVRGLLLAMWLTAGAAVGWLRVVRPLVSAQSPAELAALVESHYPGLAERLTTLVELSRRIEPANGSRALVGVLGRETERRVRRLDFTSATPYRPALRVGAGAAVAAVLLLSPLAFVSGSTERVRRLVLPWYTPPVRLPFRLVVSSGDPVVKRGEPVTLTAYLERTEPGAPLPSAAVLVVRPPGTRDEKKLPMTGDEASAFTLTRPGVAEDFEYRVEAGKAVSEWHAVAVVEPVALADGTSVTVTPPAYAELPPQTRDGFTEFEALQHGTASLALRFNRAPAEASLVWTPAVATMTDNPRSVSLAFATDRLSATAGVPLAADGTLRLVLTGDRGVRTDIPAAVRVTPDAPPRFDRAVGLTADTREARPDDTLPIDLTVTDDVRVARLEFDYFLKDGVRKSEPIPLPGVGGRRVTGRAAFALAGKAAEGEVVHLRVRATDNRSVPERGLEPQGTVYPPNGWAVIHVTASARPLAEQDVLAQRDRLRGKLAEIVQHLTAAANETAQVQARPAPGPLPLDQAVRLRDARDKTVTAARQLDALADETDQIPDLRSVAGEARDVAAGPFRGAESALRTAEADPGQPARDKSLAAASAKLHEAVEQLTRLTDRAEQATQERLDRRRLEELAEAQKALADEAARPDAAADELAQKQRDLAGRLADAVAQSDELRKAANDAAAQEARDLAARLKQLADDAAALVRAAEQTDEAARLERTREVARLQGDLSGQAARLAGKTETAARLAGTAPLPRRPFDAAQDELSRGNPADAAAEQEKAARELDRLADALARAARERGDTQQAARQVARWQDDLRRRFEETTRSATADTVPADARKRFADEQRAVREVTEKLRIDDRAANTSAAQAAAEQTTAEAAAALDERPADAAGALKKATEALNKLADTIPSRDARLRQAKANLDQLRREQDAIAKEVFDAARGAHANNPGGAGPDEPAKKLIENAAKQEELARKVHQLDTPGHETRRDVAAGAAGRAAGDLRAGLPGDAATSQQDTRRQLDRLREALDGQTPADEQAAEAARLQRAVADAADQLPAKPTADDLKRVGELQREATRRLGGINAPEAAGPLADARRTPAAVDQALRTQEPVDELRKKSKDAARAADALSDRLTDAESDRQRVERLTRERKERAEEAERAAQTPASADESARAKRDVQRQLDELRRSRAGQAQQAKKDAEDALERLHEAANPDRQSRLQRAAADALDRLTREMARNGDRDTPARTTPPEPTEADELRRATGGGSLPAESDAAAARELARLQRDLRDAASQAAADLARGTKPAAQDDLGRLAQEQEEIAKAVKSFAEKVHPDNTPAGAELVGKAEAAAGEAAGQLRTGSVESARKAGTGAEGHLREVAKQAADRPAVGRGATDLADRQAALNDHLGKMAGDRAAELARQRQRQAELAEEAGRVADAARAAEQAAADPQAAARLGQAAADVAKARDRMAQAARDADVNRGMTGQREAAETLRGAAETASDAGAGTGPGAAGGERARAAGGAVREASGQMRQAESHLGRPVARPAAAGAMRRAADSLSRAAQSLAQSQGEGRSNGGPTSGANDGGGSKPRTEKDLPPEVAQYLGKPWGELPGEVRDRIIQEVAAKYGDDYARTIKLYFQQIATRK